jgi:peptidase E
MIILTANGKFLYEYSIDSYLPKPLAECTIAYIITAATKMDETGDVEKTRLRDHITRYKQKMNEMNYHYTEIDIAGLSEQELKSTLSAYDIVLVE